MEHDEMLTTEEVGKLFGGAVDTVRKYKKLGLIEPMKKVGASDLWDKSHIIRMRHIIKSGKRKDKTLMEIAKDIELIKEEQNISEDGAKRILIIEDDKGLIKLYKDSFRIRFPDKKLRIEYAEDGLTGTEWAIRIKPHVIMLDLALPEKSGMDVHKELKDHPSTRNTEFIIISGNIEDYQPKDVIFFQKPFNLIKLLDTVDILIETQLDESRS